MSKRILMNLNICTLNKVYLVKNISPWILDELIAFSKRTKFTLFIIRKPSVFYHDRLQELKNNNIEIFIEPFKFNISLIKLFFVFRFIISNFNRFSQKYSLIIGIKSIVWFLKFDLSKIKPPLSIYAQFATQPSIIALMIKKYYKSDVEYYFTFHAYDIFFNNRWFTKLVNESRFSFSISNYNINYVLQKYKNLNPNKIVLMHSGVFQPSLQISKNRFNNNNIFTMGFLSWFVPKKGLFYLLKAIKIISMQNDFKIKLIIAGDGPLKNKAINYIKNNKLEKNISYIGKIDADEKIKFYEKIEAFILPAISLKNDKDGIPATLMEAISFGLPIISTNISGIPEICINNFNGFLINEKNVEEIVMAIEKLYTHKPLRIKFSSNSLVLSNEYNITLNSEKKMKKMNWL